MKKQIGHLVYLLLIGLLLVFTNSCEEENNDDNYKDPEPYTTAWYLMQGSWILSECSIKMDCSDQNYAMPWTELSLVDYQSITKFFPKGVIKVWVNGELFESSEENTWYVDESKNPPTLNVRVSGLSSYEEESGDLFIGTSDIEMINDEQFSGYSSRYYEVDNVTVLYSSRTTYEKYTNRSSDGRIQLTN